MIRYEPTRRLTPLQALGHPFFDDLRDPSKSLPDGKPFPAGMLDFNDEEIVHCTPEFLDLICPDRKIKKKRT
jgi:hypothetical protein